MADGLKYSLTATFRGLPGNMISIVPTLSSLRGFLACSTDGGQWVLEYLGSYIEMRYVLLMLEQSGLIRGSEVCLIDFLTVTSDAPETLKVGTGNMKLTPVSKLDV